MNKIKAYFEEVSNELLNKVTWPTWSELQESAIIVMVASIIIALVVGAMDFGFNKLMGLIYSL
ncbi:MAG: preprotein translocase subunit SecE [Bacteroidetes bacterium]|nr:MAG: preprotein translocase subunit SecE [Bacteroidota bacterium]